MRLIGPLLTLAAIVASCGGADDGDGYPTAVSPPPERPAPTTDAGARDPAPAVQTTMVTLTDPTRSTPATAAAAARTQRELETHLYEPAGEGPFPLILFAHGLDGHPRKFTQLHTAWADAGYVVAAPTFPVSNDEAPGGGDLIDLAEQPADLRFVLDQLLGPDTPLDARVDPARIGAGGLSLGGATVYGFVYDDCCRDDRVAAAMVLDGNELSFTPDLTRGPPLLLAHADPDPALPYANAVGHFAAATVPAAFLTVHETAHAEPFEDTAHVADEVVEAVTIAWWDHWLGGDGSDGPLRRIDAAVTAAGPLASWQARLG